MHHLLCAGRTARGSVNVAAVAMGSKASRAVASFASNLRRLRHLDKTCPTNGGVRGIGGAFEL
ncbi:hypothetical protein LU699_02125 [Luteimonas fraxinea]|uniref:Uncharacterized protein n=1 Tax=Luteimonas fraxinea TaxID=2901869 RepID=A0ABS8UFZ9_9GAMM|nr:hypothetical protein [Luteimonas fraxinea]MCD9098442.1 hypothetical protein [Luteimonas fraxinea]MCD9127175.1 hypothetical protein [Luteimonas fraxinea]UHH10553.1 hypothetical protein LU699_02125 [Luteimonas fraxinea]